MNECIHAKSQHDLEYSKCQKFLNEAQWNRGISHESLENTKSEKSGIKRI